MKRAEIIARYAERIEELTDELRDYERRVKNAIGLMIRIGGPLNDNKLGYTKEQLVTFKQIEEILVGE